MIILLNGDPGLIEDHGPLQESYACTGMTLSFFMAMQLQQKYIYVFL